MNPLFQAALKPLVAAALLALSLGEQIRAQNLVEDPGNGEVLPPIQITAAYASNWTFSAWVSTTPAAHPATRMIQQKLESHVRIFLEGYPWRPLHLTLGISGHEVCFGHPDELFYALALAHRFLSPSTQASAARLLDNCVNRLPPYAVEGFSPQTSRPRESYDVPENLRSTRPVRANSLFGVYAFWLYCHEFNLPDTARAHWPKIQERIRGVPISQAAFDPRKDSDAKDEAEALNGNLAGWLGYARLARMVGDSQAETTALGRLQTLLETRINYERVRPRILTPTSSTSKHLHITKLARYCYLTPEIARALRQRTEGCSARRLQVFREARPGWFMAFGDRYIGGENYTSPPHLAQALFLGAAWIELLPPRDLSDCLDVPWCQGDFYFLEKCAAILAGPAYSS
ncbi:MAG TPA: hypothetical protein P5186_04755 [Candidatus Paceibacterota bacterium]|nr:hypothetical protein [Verrucomicrobiota bacterium]HRY47337.1 hypothetical protein [Candidatus Paceibacterota bacterium]